MSILVLLGVLVAACGSDEPTIPFDPEEIHLEILGPERAAETEPFAMGLSVADERSRGAVEFDDSAFPVRLRALLHAWANGAPEWEGDILHVKTDLDVPIALVLAAEALVAEVGWDVCVELWPDDPLALLARLERGELR